MYAICYLRQRATLLMILHRTIAAIQHNVVMYRKVLSGTLLVPHISSTKENHGMLCVRVLESNVMIS